MTDKMVLPQYYNLVRVVAQIVAALGCLAGVVLTLGALSAFKFGFIAGVSALFSGAMFILGSLAALGVTYCFLAMVKAQIDSRNAIISYISAQSKD